MQAIVERRRRKPGDLDIEKHNAFSVFFSTIIEMKRVLVVAKLQVRKYKDTYRRKKHLLPRLLSVTKVLLYKDHVGLLEHTHIHTK